MYFDTVERLGAVSIRSLVKDMTFPLVVIQLGERFSYARSERMRPVRMAWHIMAMCLPVADILPAQALGSRWE